MRLAIVAMLIGTLSAGRALAADDGDALLHKFAETCATKPVSAEALDMLARAVGYMPEHGPVAPDDLSRNPDDIYSAKLPDQGSNFAISAYFGGSRAHYEVSCGMRGQQVDASAFVELLRRETTLPDPQIAADAEIGKQTFVWTADDDGGKDKLEIDAFTDGRLSLTFTYDVISR
jgi:hypothetical protein